MTLKYKINYVIECYDAKEDVGYEFDDYCYVYSKQSIKNKNCKTFKEAVESDIKRKDYPGDRPYWFDIKSFSIIEIDGQNVLEMFSVDLSKPSTPEPIKYEYLNSECEILDGGWVVREDTLKVK